MGSLLGGIDFSSRAIHIALVPLDADNPGDTPSVTLRHYVLPVWKPASTTPQYRSVERCRLVRDAMRDLLRFEPFVPLWHGTDDDYLAWRKLCEGQTLEESSHYGGYRRCWESATRVEHIRGRSVALCRKHVAEDASPPDRERAEVAHVCVEEPFGSGRKADNVMRELYGAILASIPPHIQRDTIGTQEWRRIIWPQPLERPLSGDEWKLAARDTAYGQTWRTMDEHEAESYLIATAARHRLDAATRSIA